MSLSNRKIAPYTRNFPLKQRNSPVSAVTTNQWFADAPFTPLSAITYRGSSRLFDFIRNLSPTLALSQIYKIDYCARYAAMATDSLATGIIARFLENSNSIWDLRDYNYQFQDDSAVVPVTNLGQNVRLIKPLTGGNNLQLHVFNNYNFVPATSDLVNGLLFLSEPHSSYTCNTVTAKTVILSAKPIQYSNSVSAVDYNTPFMLGTENSYVYDFHPSADSSNSYFDPTYAASAIRNGNLRLNGNVVLIDNLTKQFNLHLLSIATKNNETVSFNCVSTDRSYTTGPPYRRFVGNYRVIFASNNSYTEAEVIQLNRFCQLYAGLI
jgi:hypothetical protein